MGHVGVYTVSWGIKTFGINAASRRRGGGSSGTSPAALSNITLFWNGTKGNIYQDNPPTTPVVNAGDPVAFWLETIGGNNATIGSGTPDYAELGTNLLPSVNTVTGERLDSVNVGNINTTTAFTAGVVVRFNSTMPTYSAYLGKWTGANRGWFFGIHDLYADKPVMYYETSPGAAGIIVYGSTVLSANTNYRLLVDSEGTDVTGVTILVDGVEETVSEFTYGGAAWGDACNNSDPFFLGDSAAGTFDFDGKLALPFLAYGSHAAQLAAVDTWMEEQLG